MHKPVGLSASKIKTFESCSFLGYAKYELKLPDETNNGALLGSIIHELLEILAVKPEKYKSLLITTELEIPSYITRWFIKKLKKSNILSEDNLVLLRQFFIRGFNYDFWLEGAIKVLPCELEFNIALNSRTNVKGFIDRAGIYKDGEDYYVVIRDYKSQKKPFTPLELKKNIQAMIYLLAIKNLYPYINLEKSRVEFVLLKKQKQFIQIFDNWDNEQNMGVFSYLEGVGEYLDNFSIEKAKSNYAANGGYDRSWLCGNAKFPGELKSDGSPKWYCKFKFPFSYYAAVDFMGEVLRTAKTLIDLNLQEGEILVQKDFGGCPFFFSEESC
jgi:hypothetical protein